MLMDAICGYLPSPKDAGQIMVTNPRSKQEESIDSDATGPLAALVFKTSADPYVGKLTYFRVYSGTMHSDSSVWNANKETQERIGQLYMLKGKAQEPVSNVIAGDIGAVAKLTETGTGDTFCGKDRPFLLTAVEFPRPCMSVSVNPKTKADMDKLGPSLATPRRFGAALDFVGTMASAVGVGHEGFPLRLQAI